MDSYIKKVYELRRPSRSPDTPLPKTKAYLKTCVRRRARRVLKRALAKEIAEALS